MLIQLTDSSAVCLERIISIDIINVTNKDFPNHPSFKWQIQIVLEGERWWNSEVYTSQKDAELCLTDIVERVNKMELTRHTTVRVGAPI